MIDDEIVRTITELSALAPLQHPPALAAIEQVREAFPAVPQVAVFDTAFHASIPAEAATYAIPAQWREWGVRRYGFHGLAVAWIAEQVRVPRLVVCHLGGGCSVTAVRDGRSVDTTMGFSPLEGVPMATRSGSVDPGALVYLLRERALSVDELDRALQEESGLAALGGLDDELGFAVYTYRVALAAAAMVAALGGLDVLVFSGGVGENRPDVREAVVARLRFVGDFRVEVVPVREELVDRAGRASAARTALSDPYASAGSSCSSGAKPGAVPPGAGPPGWTWRPPVRLTSSVTRSSSVATMSSRCASVSLPASTAAAEVLGRGRDDRVDETVDRLTLGLGDVGQRAVGVELRAKLVGGQPEVVGRCLQTAEVPDRPEAGAVAARPAGAEAHQRHLAGGNPRLQLGALLRGQAPGRDGRVDAGGERRLERVGQFSGRDAEIVGSGRDHGCALLLRAATARRRDRCAGAADDDHERRHACEQPPRSSSLAVTSQHGVPPLARSRTCSGYEPSHKGDVGTG